MGPGRTAAGLAASAGPGGLFPLVPFTWHHDLVYHAAWPWTRHSPPPSAHFVPRRHQTICP